MKRNKPLGRFTPWMLAFGISMALWGCAGEERPAAEYAGIMKEAADHTYVLGAMTRHGFDTPPYIPGKIRFELEIYLREMGLLAEPGRTDRTLTVDIASEVVYSMTIVHPSRVPAEDYQELISTVRVTRTDTGEAVAEAVFRSYNSFGGTGSEFTEMEHAKDISRFLESIVR